MGDLQSDHLHLPVPSPANLRCFRAERRRETAHYLPPRADMWGIGYIGRSAEPAHDGTGGVLWFETREALLLFVTDDLICLLPEVLLGDPRPVESALERAARLWAESSTEFECLRVALTPILGRFSWLEWIGQLDDLLSGDGEFGRETRWSFRENDKLRDDPDGNREQASSSPIEADEVKEFVRALSGWWR